MKIQKPFLKWVGGKHKLLTHIINKIPKKINSNPIFINGSILYLDVKNKLKIIS